MAEDFGKLFKVFLQARDKNVGEEAKLQKTVQELDMKKYNSKMFLSNAIFEQKLEAYKLQREVKDIQMRTRAKEKKTESSSIFDISLIKIDDSLPGGVKIETTNKSALFVTGVRQESTSNEALGQLNEDKDHGSQTTRSPRSNHFGYTSDSECGVTLPSIGARILWAGDPQAIASVRRSRKDAQEELKKEENLSGIRKAKRDISRRGKFTCSRNCTKPGTIFETVASSNIISLPMLKKDIRILARDERRRQKQLSQLPTIESVPLVAHNPRNIHYLRPNKFDRLAIRSLPWLNVPQPNCNAGEAKERTIKHARRRTSLQVTRVEGLPEFGRGSKSANDHDAHAIDKVFKLNCGKTPFVK